MKTMVFFCGLVLVIVLGGIAAQALWLLLGYRSLILAFALLFLLFWLVGKVLR